MAVPCALVVSCADLPAENLVKQILCCHQLPTAIPVVETIKSYPWHVDTKYYTADIRLCTILEKSLGNLEFAENVHAVVIYFDSRKESSFHRVKEWMSFIKEYSAQVQILVCENCVDTDYTTKKDIQLWSLKNNFELVELNPDDADDSDDDFHETTGVERIIQALRAHVWPNLVLKDQPSFGASVLEKSSVQLENKDDNVQILTNKFSELSNDDEKGAEALSLNEDEIIKILGADDPDGVSFETLFERFHQMKETAQHLPFEERKAYAEKVAIAFWHAIGGEDSEIEGLDDK